MTIDVIAASNILHVTGDLDRTLQRLRKLLKVGGKLRLNESICPERIDTGFVFGLLPGWWPDTDENRVMSPLSSEETWGTLLRRNGFSRTDFTLRDFADEDSHIMSIICTTAIGSGPVNRYSLPEVTIAVEPSSTVQG